MQNLENEVMMMLRHGTVIAIIIVIGVIYNAWKNRSK